MTIYAYRAGRVRAIKAGITKEDYLQRHPDVNMGLNKARAYEMLEEVLKNDVLEVE